MCNPLKDTERRSHKKKSGRPLLIFNQRKSLVFFTRKPERSPERASPGRRSLFCFRRASGERRRVSAQDHHEVWSRLGQLVRIGIVAAGEWAKLLL